MPIKQPPSQSRAELEASLHAICVERANHLADIRRVFAWLDTPNRKPAIMAFTEGPERQVAYRFEMALRGEHICTKCGLRQQNGETPAADF